VDDEEFNRDDPTIASALMQDLCPALHDRRLVLSQLIRSMEFAERLAPDSCSVTMWRNGFRLNVGQVESFVFIDAGIRLFLFGSFPSAAQEFGEIVPARFHSIPQPHYGYFGDVRGFERAGSHLQPSHLEFLRVAALTTRGKPRRSPFRRTHSPGLVQYARSFAEEGPSFGVR
jgi:hypothetical protein